ncbi:uncharacterized protein PHACADRAFT_254707 [Phanerochaete carnosa HHB-10118-sp]|uniref:Uncharacterized protein n=1 Tax=Phanerochaete carnosa (strain HHB-10118-sp) TaxID=650164 RepID=K5VZW3_PHACS|nr:uncharacterized protein PHACADRAFT_254707 [Phanerochaete carnosa HHB-10118-sp]EKM57128.1 hypothetical protein PHACADRAFT_254707 [Phanerochaete carnosa HHB-10118-sp]
MSNKSSTHLPTDEELLAEAERERERSRREAERIITREAESKRLEERVLAMLDGDMRKLPPPVTPTMSSTPPSPSGSNKEGTSWLSAFKNKLTPTKEPLTPAQQIIQETKAREKEIAKEEKKMGKEKKEIEKEMKKVVKKQSQQRSGDWPSSPEGKFNDPVFMNLHAPGQSSQPPARQTTGSPISTPARQISLPPSLAPSPLRNNDGRSTSPGRSGPPLYAQFTPEGSLDIPSTLLTVATRFEKLERWTVGHVRALEERMDDVERWLVDKEREKEKDKESQEQSNGTAVQTHRTGEPATLEAAIGELRDELAEVQGRIGELGREMAKMVTAPGNLSSGPSRGSASIGRSPSASSSIALRSMSTSVSTAPRTSTSPTSAKEPSTSPIATPSTSSRTRLPYPTGDYATPPDSVHITQGAFSPPASPPDSGAGRRVSVSGLPSTGSDYFASSSSPSSGLPTRALSPPPLPPPPAQAELRRSSVSPTPRKRYTVALGDSIMSASDRGRSSSRGPSTIRLSSSPASMSTLADTTEDSDDADDVNDETIGKTAARRSGLTRARFDGNDSDRSSQPSPSPAPLRQGRARPVSMYSTPVSSLQNLIAPTAVRPLNMRSRSRSRSMDKSAIEASTSSVSVPQTPSSARFVDPLIVRRQTREIEASQAPPAPKVMPGKSKVPIGQLVAFFDQEKR